MILNSRKASALVAVAVAVAVAVRSAANVQELPGPGG